MGVYIKGMEMPESCIKCKEYQPYREYCKRLKRYLIGTLWKDERHEDCPLVEVSEPHGRLIDADYVLSKLYKREPEFTEEIEWIQACIALLNHAPTVIEAELEK